MLTINIICIGKLKESYLRDAQAEYQKRLGAFCKLNIIELNESKLPNDPSDAQIQKGMEIESQAILSKLKGYIVPMCIEGKILSSEDLATKMNEVSLNGTSEISFVIGGSFGLSNEVKQKADFKLSMSKMTFPHQLARIMLLEQVYRGFQINSNGKYHK
ncbi:23S rRNA (pseudouridine(1915)-N(3))-methyltransferase RlmH [Paludicola sp. MB14-C6]|uniref:23S rRNA (pseudouridine(1915)-N(3))-methyltransferase RlmH n=1 Tax=Paludihabitans sp. MB14-C6 TaxID=3070656 RepID=UPI0027DD8D74|nr:23S rRNA (pseudouridine(1915)-N(3))-methyltransferase RlmH [Paludicola sp. MB14-C6]WMJ24014.1 23S rRNA (pseudouridine(1915)-N(3))-methyltransferase RlmH [Paludicola sp. MB14-C6]